MMLLLVFLVGIITYIFYKIFSNSLIVISKFEEKKAFTIEEVLGASLLISIAVSALGNFTVLGLEVRNVISILLVLILGWKNGILVGASSGITIGSVLGIIGMGEPIMIASYALSGMMAGLFSRFGKIGVILGFIAGNTALTYAANGNTLPIIYFKEILVASLGLLLVPKRVQINIQELFPKDAYLPGAQLNRLPESKITLDKLDTVSETIQEISESYQTGEISEEEIREENKKIFKTQFLSDLEEKEENILYEDFMESNQLIEDIFAILESKEEIEVGDIVNTFEKHHQYLLIAQDKEENQKMEKDLQQITRIANESYTIGKMKFMYKKRIDENKKNMSSQLNGVSKVISSIAHDIRKEESKEFEAQEQEVKNLCKQKNIVLLDVHIKQNKNQRYIVHVYLEPESKEDIAQCPIHKVEAILTKVLKEDIVIQKENCAIKTEENICKQTYVSKDRYQLQFGIAKTTKEGSPVSGDCSVQAKLDDGKYLIAISDGMGSRTRSQKV